MKKGKAVKRTSVKRKTKINSSKKCKKSLKEKELMALAIFAFFICAFLLAVTNVPQQSVSVTGHQVSDEYGEVTKYYDEGRGMYVWRDEDGYLYDSDPTIDSSAQRLKSNDYEFGDESFIRDLFTNFGGERLDVNLGKYVIWFTLLIFIHGILTFLKFLKFKGGGFLRFMLSLGLSFLSTAYLIPEDIYIIIMSLETVPMLLTALPFLALILATGELLSVDTLEKLRKLSPAKILAAMSLWFIWIAFLAFRVVRAWIDKGFSFIFRGSGIVLMILGVVSLFILIFFGKFQKAIYKLSKKIVELREDLMGTAERARQEREARRSEFSRSQPE